MCDTCQSNRCDRCTAQAYTTWANIRIQGLLKLCAHHATQHEADMVADGWELAIDDRAKLTPA